MWFVWVSDSNIVWLDDHQHSGQHESRNQSGENVKSKVFRWIPFGRAGLAGRTAATPEEELDDWATEGAHHPSDDSHLHCRDKAHVQPAIQQMADEKASANDGAYIFSVTFSLTILSFRNWF